MDTLYGLSKDEVRLLQKLSTPKKIQDYLDALPINFEQHGETHYSPRMVVQKGTAHCIEAACFAAAALWFHGERPLIMDLHSARGDDDHVVALYRFNKHWGAISKSNHATIRWRDPVYRSLRELALSYFHEWFPERTGIRTLRAYSDALDLRRFGTDWITSRRHLWWLDRELNNARHHQVAPAANLRQVRRADPMEIMAGSLVEFQPPSQ